MHNTIQFCMPNVAGSEMPVPSAQMPEVEASLRLLKHEKLNPIKGKFLVGPGAHHGGGLAMVGAGYIHAQTNPSGAPKVVGRGSGNFAFCTGALPHELSAMG